MGRPSKPRFEKDSSSQESFGLSALAPFGSSANRPNGKQTDAHSNLSPGHSSINPVVPFSQPLLTHLISNQQSMSTNSFGHSSGKSGLRFPADVLQKTQQNDGQWNLGTYQPQQLSMNVTRSGSGLWSSIDGLNGGEMMIGEEDRVVPKQELLFDDFAEVGGFELDSRDMACITEQPIPNDSFEDVWNQTADDAGQLLWQRGRPALASSQQSRLTLAMTISPSPSIESGANGLCSRIDAALCRGKTLQMAPSASLPNNASISLETRTADDARNKRNDTLAADPAEISVRRVTDLQFPLKSVIRIIHSSVANELPDTQNCHTPMDIEELMNRFKHYWLYDETGEDPFIVHYSNIYKEVIAAYKTFVIHSQYVNFLLRTELEVSRS